MGKLKVAVLNSFSCRFNSPAPITKEEFIPASGSGLYLESKTDFNFETEGTRFPGTGSLMHFFFFFLGVKLFTLYRYTYLPQLSLG